MCDECPEDEEDVCCRVVGLFVVTVCCMYRCNMLDSLSMMTWTGRWAWSWAMSLMVVKTVSSAGVRFDVDDLDLGGSEAMMSNEIL